MGGATRRAVLRHVLTPKRRHSSLGIHLSSLAFDLLRFFFTSDAYQASARSNRRIAAKLRALRSGAQFFAYSNQLRKFRYCLRSIHPGYWLN
jgi:hypothetical protein